MGLCGLSSYDSAAAVRQKGSGRRVGWYPAFKYNSASELEDCFLANGKKCSGTRRGLLAARFHRFLIGGRTNGKVELGTVIAERGLRSPRLSKEVLIRVGCPQRTEADDFITPYQIVGVGDEKVRFAAGLDALQSLQLVIQMISADVHYRLKEYELRWGESDNLGLPAP